VTVVLAVDGGNSKTDVARVGDDGRVLGFVRGPQCSPDHLGLDRSLEILGGLVAEVGGGDDELAVLLLAGVDFPDEEDAYRVRVDELGWATRTIVGNDTFAVLRAGSERGWGVAVTCGAGINCVGVAPDGRHVRFASLGPWSGDWGGGGDVGIAAIGAAARSEDGRGPRTPLEQLVPQHFGFETPTELARAIVRGEIGREAVAMLAPMVFEQAAHDEVSAEIVDRLSAEVVTMARTALTRLGLSGAPADVVLGGGLLQAGNERLIRGIEDGLRSVGPQLAIRIASSPAIVGSALRGLDELGASTDAQERVRAELGAAVLD